MSQRWFFAHGTDWWRDVGAERFLKVGLCESSRIHGGPRWEGCLVGRRCQIVAPTWLVITINFSSPQQRWHLGRERFGDSGWNIALPSQYVQPIHNQTSQRTSASCSLQLGLIQP